MKRLMVFLIAALLLAGCTSEGETVSSSAQIGHETAEVMTTEADSHAVETAAEESSAQESFAQEAGSQTAVLAFSSFDGGGHEYTAEIEDPSILSYTSERDYGPNHDELEDGSGYEAVFTFTGLKPGRTTVTIYGRSPIMENDDAVYTAVVDDALHVSLIRVRKISTFFLYRNGEIYYDSYHITLEEDGYYVSVSEGEDQRIDPESVDALMQVIDKYNVEQWDGFSESEDHVLDGEGFWLEIHLTDGTSILARGDNAFPENYFPAVGEMQEILDGAKVGQ